MLFYLWLIELKAFRFRIVPWLLGISLLFPSNVSELSQHFSYVLTKKRRCDTLIPPSGWCRYPEVLMHHSLLALYIILAWWDIFLVLYDSSGFHS